MAFAQVSAMARWLARFFRTNAGVMRHRIESAPLEPLFDTLLQLSKQCISDHETCDSQVRDSIGRFLHHFGILNRDSFRIASQDASFPAVLYYERVRMELLSIPTPSSFPDAGKVGFFWEGLPKQLSLALPTSTLLHQNKSRDLTSCDVFVHRSRFMDKIEHCKTEDEVRSIGVDLKLTCPFTLSLPVKVHAFILVMRSIFCGLRSAKSSVHFRQCWNEKCNRVFFCNSKHKLRDCFDKDKVVVETLDPPSCIPCDENSLYWHTCGSFPLYADPLERFCTSACCIEWRKRMDSLLPCNVSFTPDLEISEGNLGRINAAFKRAMNRNSDFRSKLDVILKSKKGGCVSKRLFKNEIERRVDVLNVDMALLYWSTLVSKLCRYAKDDTLPGIRPDWRTLDVNIGRCKSIFQIYCMVQEQHSRVHLITDLLSSERFLSAVKSQCMLIDKAVH